MSTNLPELFIKSSSEIYSGCNQLSKHPENYKKNRLDFFYFVPLFVNFVARIKKENSENAKKGN
jgi:hypothetical protein